jgi:HEPN domain-containing protein
LQQATEKLLKSVLSFHTISAPKTHDLEVLLEKMVENCIVIEGIEKLLPLTEFAVEGRYAIILDDIDSVEYYVGIIMTLLQKVKIIVTP